MEKIPTPYVFADLDIVKSNLTHAAKKISEVGLKHRPHIKSHKSAYFARLQQEAGANGITCAKLGEAEAMIEAGFNDILIAYPVIGSKNLERLMALSKKARIITCVDSWEGASGISFAGETLGIRLPVYIEINVGFDRCGMEPGVQILDFAKKLTALQGIEIVGIMSYAGHINDKLSKEEMRLAVREEARILAETARNLDQIGIPVDEVSVGSSLSIEFNEELNGVTEIRAGSYIFHDMGHVSSGLYTIDDCALRVAVTVVSTPFLGRAIIDAGSKTLTSDTSRRGGYGFILEHPSAEIVKLNEEHGFVDYDPSVVQLHIGDRLTVIPNHACVLPNLCDQIFGVSSGAAGMPEVVIIPIEARGKNS